MNAPLWDDAGFVIDTMIPNIPNRYDLGSASSPFRNIYANAVVIDGAIAETPALLSRAGATAGWVVTGADTGAATVPASTTAATLITPLSGIKPGDTINSFNSVGQIDSTGGTVTFDSELFRLTAAASGVTSVSLGAITQVSVVADTLLSAVNTTETLATPYVATANDSFYVKTTVTTGLVSSVSLAAIRVNLDQA
jgi:hypothetical protein